MSKIDCENVCVEKLEEVLQTLNVKRQAYHGKSFVGNHVHKMLKVKIINIIELPDIESWNERVYHSGLCYL